MSNIYLISAVVFVSIMLIMVLVLLFLENKIAPKGAKTLTINDTKQLNAKVGASLLAALAQHSIYLPSACGGKGTCGLCKCKVLDGGGKILATELPHLSRTEKQNNLRLACQLKIKNDLELSIPPEILGIKKYQGTVVSNNNVSSFIKELVVKMQSPEPIAFKPGAYMQIDVPDKPPTFRAYSLANYPGEPYFMFNVRLATPPPNTSYPPGVGSSYLFSLKPGDTVTLAGSFGDFFIKDTMREMCFIGGGAGMAPLRSQILDQLKNHKTSRKITFWYGARSKMEMFYDDKFKQLAQAFTNFEYTVALSEPAPNDDWDGSPAQPVGFIHQVAHDLYLAKHKEPDEIEYYLCGPPIMLKSCLNMLDALGVEPEMIAYDDFGNA